MWHLSHLTATANNQSPLPHYLFLATRSFNSKGPVPTKNMADRKKTEPDQFPGKFKTILPRGTVEITPKMKRNCPKK
jgi:hypothetical protein